MDLSSPSMSAHTETYTVAIFPEMQSEKNLNTVDANNSSDAINSDNTTNSCNLYESAIDSSLTRLVSFTENANNNSSLISTTSSSTPKAATSSGHNLCHTNSSSDFYTTLNASEIGNVTTEATVSTIADATVNDNLQSVSEFGSHINTVNSCTVSHPALYHRLNNVNASKLLIQSDSAKTNISQEDVDTKSQLANKTIFKNYNPNLSIIEINENSIRNKRIKNGEFVGDTSNDDLIEPIELKQFDGKHFSNVKATSSNINGSHNKLTVDNAIENRRRKTESLIHSSKQKLNIAIAEASAAESASPAAAVGDAAIVGNSLPPATKREIKIYDSLEEFEKNLPSTVTVLDTPFGSKVYLVGTAHFSEESQDDVSFVIRNVRPDVVMVELCPSRIPILKLDEKTLLEEAKNFDAAKIRSIIQSHGYINGIFFILLLQTSAQIAKDLGMAPGGEFRRAFEEIHKLPGCMLHLGDRPIRITLYRALRALSLWQTIKLVWRLTSTDTISIEEVEECKQRDLLEKLMQEMAGEFPAFSDVFVKERDLFLCHSLQMAALPQMPVDGAGTPKPVKVVGVVGIGHANGIAKMWGHVDPQTIPAIMEIPPASLTTRICKYTFKYSLIGLTIYGAFKLLRPRLARFY